MKTQQHFACWVCWLHQEPPNRCALRHHATCPPRFSCPHRGAPPEDAPSGIVRPLRSCTQPLASQLPGFRWGHAPRLLARGRSAVFLPASPPGGRQKAGERAQPVSLQHPAPGSPQAMLTPVRFWDQALGCLIPSCASLASETLEQRPGLKSWGRASAPKAKPTGICLMLGNEEGAGRRCRALCV